MIYIVLIEHFGEIDKENYTEDVQDPINKESVSLLNKGQEKIIK